MTRSLLFTLLLCMLAVSTLIAQPYTVRGKVVDKQKNLALIGVHIKLTNLKDPEDTHIVPTDNDGNFRIDQLKTRSYRLEASYIGYSKFYLDIVVDKPEYLLGVIDLSESSVQMGEVVIHGRTPPAEQKGDTTEYNAAAFKMNKDASAEDLVTKMPGVTVENGTVKAQGEDVQQVLVDGRQFFGSDPTLALRNLPAEIIDRVQVFDKLSEQSQLTGFNDGQTTKTMNIVTRADRRQGQFGRFFGAVGNESKYNTSGSMNIFGGNTRLSVVALSNNVNQQNFSSQDLLGVMGGGGRGGAPGGGGRGGQRGGAPGGGGMRGGQSDNFFVGAQNGIAKTHSLGLNYADSLWKNAYIMGSYFFNTQNTANPQTTHREYAYAADSGSYYDETSDANRDNFNHRMNMRIEYAVDSMNTVMFIPNLSFQNNESVNSVTAWTSTLGNSLLSRSENRNTTTTSGHSAQNRLILRHRFDTPGRTISTDFGFNKNEKNSDNDLRSVNYYSQGSGVAGAPGASDTANQHSRITTDGYTVSANIAYTEPVSTSGMLQLNFNPSYTKNTSENRTNSFDPRTQTYSVPDSILSNTFDNTYATNSAGIGYFYRVKEMSFNVGVSYQIASLRGSQTYPRTVTVDKTFNSVLPSAMISYELKNHNGLRFYYRASTQSPSITQLQNVLDNSNPLLLSTGNPNLKESYGHSMTGRFSWSDFETARNAMLFLSFNQSRNYIGRSSYTAPTDTVVDGIALKRGIQLSRPVNLDGYYNIRSFFTYGLPFDLISSNVNGNIGGSYARSPGSVNGMNTMTDVYTISPGVVVGSNISPDFDFTLSYTANFNMTKNSLQASASNDYATHVGSAKVNWIIWKGFLLRTDMNYSRYAGLSTGLNQQTYLWNVSVGKKLFANDQGEITFSVYDVLNQNKNINRTITETYIEDIQSTVLKQYFLLTFTYNLRNFGGGSDMPPPRRDRDPHFH